MSAGQPSAAARRRFGPTVIAFVVGVPLGAALIALVHFGPLRESALYRYVMHPVECVEVVMACVALGALAAKLVSMRAERAALKSDLLPAWDGKAVPVTEAPKLLADLEKKPRGLRDTFLGRRVAAVLDFLRSRGSAKDLDDHMRSLVDTDALALDASYSLVRLITWAVPILGFLGTVLGITKAISGVTPDQLEHSISGVTDGLAEAFDTTALALGLTMVVMFISYLIERFEQSTLEEVDQQVEQHLAHRFERLEGQGNEVVDTLRQNTQVLLQTAEQLVQGQAAAFGKVLAELDQRRREAEQQAHDRLGAALETALDKTLDTHSKRLAAIEKSSTGQSGALLEKLSAVAAAVRESNHEQQEAFAKVARGLTAQTEALTQLQAGERQLVRLQESLQQNLNALAASGTFEQAVHSLTAAIHLLTMHQTPANRRSAA